MRSRLSLCIATAVLGLSLTACDVSLNSSGSPPPGGTASSAIPLAPGTDSLVVLPQDGMAPVYNLLKNAKHTIDLTMYELQDTTATNLLAAAAARSVDVRVLLDHSFSGTHNDVAQNFLASHGVHVRWAPPLYEITHQKTLTVDGTTTVVMTFNWQTQYYSSTRDVGVIDNDAADVKAIEAVFNADFAATPITPSDGDDLVWSPTDAEPSILQVINSAKTTLLVENEEMASTAVINALIAAASRGVNVQVCMTNSSSWTKDFSNLQAGGVHIKVYAPNAALYIHAKVIASESEVFVGSQNFSTTSLTKNRELGIVLHDATLLATLSSMVQKDLAGATAWR